MSKFCNKHVKSRTQQELEEKINELEPSKARDNAIRELKRRALQNRSFSGMTGARPNLAVLDELS